MDVYLRGKILTPEVFQHRANTVPTLCRQTLTLGRRIFPPLSAGASCPKEGGTPGRCPGLRLLKRRPTNRIPRPPCSSKSSSSSQQGSANRLALQPSKAKTLRSRT